MIGRGEKQKTASPFFMFNFQERITVMKCLLKYQWLKLPREELLSHRKGIMGYWAKLASRAAFRNGYAKYCGYRNKVTAGTWAGGIVGIKSILGVKSRAQALEVLEQLSEFGYITYRLDPKTKKLTYKINDWVVKCSGDDCNTGTVYATTGYGFLCLPRNITERLVKKGYKFDEADAWLDLWCHTVYRDPRNAFSYMAPTVQLGQYGSALTLENLGQRWGWEKTKVWRFLQKNRDAFTSHKLPGSFGCLIFNIKYPSGTEFVMPTQQEVTRILEQIRILGQNTHLLGSDNYRINRLIAWYSKKICVDELQEISETTEANGRVAVSCPIIRAYFSHCWNCKNYIKDCERKDTGYLQAFLNQQIRGPCKITLPHYFQTKEEPSYE